MLITRVRLTELYKILKDIPLEGLSANFKFAIARTRDRMEPEIKAINVALKAPAEFEEYVEKKRGLAGKDSSKLDAEYADVLTKLKDTRYERDEFLRAEVNIDVETISKSSFYKEKIDKINETEQVQALFIFIGD